MQPIYVLFFLVTFFVALEHSSLDLVANFLESNANTASGILRPDTITSLVILAAIPFAQLFAFLFPKAFNSGSEETSLKRRFRLGPESVLMGAGFYLVLFSNWKSFLSYGLSDFTLPLFIGMVLPMVLSCGLREILQPQKRQSLVRPNNELVRRKQLIHVLPFLVPLSLILLVNDLFSVVDIKPELAKQVLQSTIVILIITNALPRMVLRLIDSDDLQKTDIGKRLDHLTSTAKTPLSEIRSFKTNNRLLNAFLIGMFPHNRVVILTDRLLSRLSTSEVEAIFLHELGHAKRNHLLQKLVAALVPFLCCQVCCAACGIQGSIATILSALCAITGLCVISHCLEYEADQFAIEQLSRNDRDRLALRRALERIRSETPSTDRISLFHPRLSDRIRALNHAPPNLGPL